MAVILYMHIPFCRGRCRYCAFASGEYDADTADAYLTALAQEFDARASFLSPATVYIGGGTPTALDVRQLGHLADILMGVDLAECAEFTVEANPGTLTMDKLLVLRRMGATRLSLGAQSFCENGLKTLGRRHSARQIAGAVAMAREAGFDNLSLDIIYGWPGQTPDELRADLEAAARLRPEHISCYGLTVEPDTPLAELVRSGTFSMPDETVWRAMFDLAVAWLPDHGFEQYEIANFARAGQECQHNRHYWLGTEYEGLGAAAFSCREGTRFSNERDTARYIERMHTDESARAWEETLSGADRARELALIGLRMREGVDGHQFHRKTGFRLEAVLGKTLAGLVEDGWLERLGSRLRLTRKALPVADSVLSELIP